MPFSRFACLAGLASLAAVPTGLLAQRPDSVVQLPPVVVTADRRPVAREAVPATVTVLDGAELRAKGIQSVADALRDVPGLAVVRTGSFGAPTSVFTRGGESDYTKVLVDGVSVNDPGGSVDLAHLTLDNVARIEVLRGPASVVYGSDAVAGVVQIFTEQGDGPPRADLEVRGGTYGTLAVASGFHGGSERLGVSATLARHSTDGIYAFNSQYRNLVATAAAHARPEERTEAHLALRYGNALVHFPTDGNGTVLDHNAFRTVQRVTAALDVRRFVMPALELRGGLMLNQSDGALDDRADDAADTLGFFASSEIATVTRKSADLRALAYVPGGVVLTAGASLEHEADRRSSASESQYGPSSGASDASRIDRGYYLQAHAERWRHVAVSAGVRLDDNATFGTFVTGRGGVAYEPVAGTRLRASVGTAFKEPTFLESFSNSPFSTGNPDLRPERTTSWEAGVEQAVLGERVWLSLTAFGQRFRDLIQYTFAPPAPDDPNYFNVAAANARGVELEARMVPLRGLSVAAGVTQLHTEVVDAGLDTDGLQFVTGQPLLRRPASAWNMSAGYRRPGAWSAAVTLRRVGERHDRDFSVFPARAVVLPGYTTVDVAGSLRVAQFTLDAGVANLFNATYQSVYGFSAARRTLSAGAGLTF